MDLWLRRTWWIILLGMAVVIYWQLPISGEVIVSPQPLSVTTQWPRITLDPPTPRPGQQVTVTVTDTAPWTHVRLTVNGRLADYRYARAVPGGTTWMWVWAFIMPTPAATADAPDGTTLLEFYRDCDSGCRLRGRLVLESAVAAQQHLPETRGPATKLCTVLPDPARDWHGRSGWVVELTYAQLADDEDDRHWSTDELAQRVQASVAKGLRVLVRVDYDQVQSVPPTGDFLALDAYLDYLQRLARDERLRDVYGYIIGSGYNTVDGNTLTQQPATAEWYARLFNGYGETITHEDNVLAVVRAENPHVRVLVGPVRPWSTDQDGAQTFRIDAPWLNYMNTLVAALDESAQEKAAADIPLMAPDGFAVNAAGLPSAAEAAGQDAADEPTMDLTASDWNDAHMGFRIYRDWLEIINQYPTTAGAPIFINATNTSAPPTVPAPDGPDDSTETLPAQNYPSGWLTTALQVVNGEPQIQALCWFLDLVPGDHRWDAYSLAREQGRMIYVAEEFEELLRGR